jgi:beta-lactamase class A
LIATAVRPPLDTPSAGVPPAACADRPGPSANGDSPPPPRVSASGRLLSNTGARPARPFQALPFMADAGLQAIVQTAVGSANGSYAVVVKDLATGRGASLNTDRVFYAASIFKVSVMFEVFNQAAQGLLDLDTELQLTPYYEGFGLGPRLTTLCQDLTVQDALHAMMSVSDNAVAVLLQDLVGAGNINNSLQALGLKETRLLPEDLPLTAGDIALLLEAIGRGLAVDAASSEAMLRLMVSERIDNGVKAGLPTGTTVAHKTGNWGNATHDVAIVYSPRSTYLLVVLSDRNHEVAVTRAVSQAVYQYFNP